MTHYDQFVLNSPCWSDTGLAVDDGPVVNVATPGGFTVNVCGCGDGTPPLSPPKTLRSFVCPRYLRPGGGGMDFLPLPTLNSQVVNCAQCSHNADCPNSDEHSFDTTTPGVKRGGPHSQDRFYNLDNNPGFRDFDDDEEAMQEEQQRRLGLAPDDPLPLPPQTVKRSGSNW